MSSDKLELDDSDVLITVMTTNYQQPSCNNNHHTARCQPSNRLYKELILFVLNGESIEASTY
jgi:hypothetical protein